MKIDMCNLEVHEASIVHAQMWPGLCRMNSGKLNSCVLPFEAAKCAPSAPQLWEAPQLTLGKRFKNRCERCPLTYTVIIVAADKIK